MKGLSKHRYYELVHWCLQYPEWEQMIRTIKFIPDVNQTQSRKSKWNAKRGTEEAGAILAEASSNMELIKRICRETSKELYSWVLLAVTKGMSFTELKMQYGIPCERDMFYDRRRKFFLLLDKEK